MHESTSRAWPRCCALPVTTPSWRSPPRARPGVVSCVCCASSATCKRNSLGASSAACPARAICQSSRASCRARPRPRCSACHRPGRRHRVTPDRAISVVPGTKPLADGVPTRWTGADVEDAPVRADQHEGGQDADVIGALKGAALVESDGQDYRPAPPGGPRGRGALVDADEQDVELPALHRVAQTVDRGGRAPAGPAPTGERFDEQRTLTRAVEAKPPCAPEERKVEGCGLGLLARTGLSTVRQIDQEPEGEDHEKSVDPAPETRARCLLLRHGGSQRRPSAMPTKPKTRTPRP